MKKLIFIIMISWLPMLAIGQNLVDGNGNTVSDYKVDKTTIAVDSLNKVAKDIKSRMILSSKIDSLDLLLKSIKAYVNFGYKLDSLDLLQKTIKDKNTTTSVTTVKGYNLQFALAGVDIVTDTVTRTGQYNGIQVLADCVIAAITYDAEISKTGNLITGFTIPSGIWLPVQITSLKLTSGKVLLPKRVK